MRVIAAARLALVLALVLGAAACGGCVETPPGSDAGAGTDASASADAGQDAGQAGDCRTDSECSDDDPCTTDRCVQGACQHPVAADGTPCGEGGDVCSADHRCEGGACVEGTPNLDVDNDGHITDACGGTDCDDEDPTVNGAAFEGDAATCDDGKDNDCDGVADDLDSQCAGRVCIGGGFCWENPLPMGNALYAVWPFSADDIYVGGVTGDFLHWDGDGFSHDVADVQGYPARFARFWAASPTDLWAAAGTLLRFDGTAWRVRADATFSANDVYGTAANDVWAVGYSGAIHHYDGSLWSEVTSPTDQTLTAVWAASPSEAWAIGASSTFLHWSGSAWSQVDAGAPPNRVGLAIWGAAGDDVWASVNDPGFLYHWDGSNWSRQVTNVINANVSGIWGRSGDDVWAVGDRGLVLHYDGAQWLPLDDSPTALTLFGLRGRGDTGVIVGDGGVMLRLEGSQWRRLGMTPPVVETNFVDVSAVGAGDDIAVAAVGGHFEGLRLVGSVAMRSADGAWRSSPTPDGIMQLTAVHLSAADHGWAAGYNTRLRYDGSAWLEDGSFSSNRGVVDICGDAGAAWAAGEELYRFDGASWTTLSYTPPVPVDHVFCVGGGEAWATGIDHSDPPVLLHLLADGAVEEVGLRPLLGVTRASHAFAPDDIWVVAGPAILHWNGGVWATVAHGSGRSFSAVGGSGPADLYFGGGYGQVLRYDGASFSPTDTPADDDIEQILMLDGAVHALTERGALYRRDASSWTELVPEANYFSDLDFAYVASVDDIWANTGAMYHWNGVEWAHQPDAPNQGPMAGFGHDDIWLGDTHRAYVHHFDGVAWTEQALGSSSSSQGVYQMWGLAPDDVWARTASALYHYDGLAWSLVALPPELERNQATVPGAAGEIWLFGTDTWGEVEVAFVYQDGTFTPFEWLRHPIGMDIAGSDDIHAVDDTGARWAWDGSGWSKLGAGPDDMSGMTQAAYIDRDDIWANVGYGVLYRWNGTAWSAVTSPMQGGYVAGGRLAASADGHLWLVGNAGAVVHRVP